jgi:hypothetical protein
MLRHSADAEPLTMRKFLFAPLALALMLTFGGTVHADDDTPKDAAKTQTDSKKDALPIPPERSVVTKHSVRIDGRTIS